MSLLVLDSGSGTAKSYVCYLQSQSSGWIIFVVVVVVVDVAVLFNIDMNIKQINSIIISFIITSVIISY